MSISTLVVLDPVSPVLGHLPVPRNSLTMV